MKCEEIKESIVDYYDGALDERAYGSVNLHLTECAACKKEYAEFSGTMELVKSQGRLNIEETPELSSFEEKLLGVIQERGVSKIRRKYGSFRKAVLIAAAIALLVMISVFTPAAAEIKSAITDITDYIFGDKGVENSIRKGYGQVIEKADTHNGLTYTVHSAISDENRTVLLVGAEYSGVVGEKADSINFYGMKITDKHGKSISSGYSSQWEFNSGQLKLSGKIDLGKLKFNESNVLISFKTAVLSREEVVAADVGLSGTGRMVINKKVILDNETMNSITLKEAVVSGDVLSIDYEVAYTDKKYMEAGPSIRLVKQDGTKCYPSESGHFYDSENGGKIGSFNEKYDVEGLELKECRLEIVYQKPVKTIEGDWKLQFEINNKAAKKATVVLKPDKSFNIGGYKMKITRVVLTPSETSVRVESKDINPLSVLGRLSLKTGGGSTVKASSGSFHTASDGEMPGSGNFAELHFEPVFESVGLSLVVHTAAIPEKPGYKLELTKEAAGVENSFKAGGREYKVKYVFLDGNRTEVVIRDTEMPLGNSTGHRGCTVYIENSKGMQIYPEMQASPVRESDYELHLIFNNPGNESGILHIESIAQNKELNMEVPIH